MTGRALTLAELDERRLELVDIKTQLRALGRRKSVVETEILTGRAAPVKGAAAEQLPLVETTPATTAPEAPAQAPEAAKPATATTTATPLRDRVRAALGAAKGRRSAKVLATLLGESEEDVADELEGLELAYEVIGRNTSDKAGRAYELRERWDARRGKGRDVRPGKVAKKPAAKSGKALWKPGYKPGILPSLTAEGNRRALEMIAAAPGKKMLAALVRAALDLPDDCCTPSGCYYQGSQAGGDWWGIRDDGAAPPRAKKPASKPPAKKAKAAKGKKVEGTRSRTRTVAEDIEVVLREWGTWFDAGQLEAKVREALPLSLGPSTAEWNNALRGLIEVKKVERREVDGRVQFRLAVAPEPKKKGKKASAKAEPTPAPEPAVDWRQERKGAVAHIAEQHKAELPIGGDRKETPRYLILVYLEAAGALVASGTGWDFELSCEIDERRISEGVWRMGLDYLLDTIEESAAVNGGLWPTASSLATMLEAPRGLVDDLVAELLDLRRLREVPQTLGSPRLEVLPSPKGKKLAPAAARTAPLFDDVEPAPDVDGLEPEGDES